MGVAVDVKGLTKVYDGRTLALNGIDLEVEAGKVFALLGPNGAGKTTLMRILTTQLKPTSGKAYVFGLNVVDEGAKVRRLVSYIPQEMSVWTDITGYENLLIYAKIYGIPSLGREKVVKEALENIGLSEAANNLVRTYSGGMIRRLEIACAMLTKPRILFLDEPTIGLDPSARMIVWEKLISYKKEYGATVFFNTHYMDEADLYSDEIGIIDRGKIVKLGTAEDLKCTVGGEVILFNVDGNQISEDVVEKVKGLSMVSDVTAEGNELRVVVKYAEGTLPGIMEVLRRFHLSVKTVSITKPTLDDVFLKYAGTRLEAGGRISEVRHVRRMIGRG